MIQLPQNKSNERSNIISSNSNFRNQVKTDFFNKQIISSLYKVKRKAQRKKFKEQNNSKWTLKENIAYKNFLKENQLLFITQKRIRRSVQINVLVSHAVKTRSSDQCRSHHQKMMKCHYSISNIILYIQQLSSIFNQKLKKTLNLGNFDKNLLQIQNQSQKSLQTIESQSNKQWSRKNIWWDVFSF